jgi:hypothetical protein
MNQKGAQRRAGLLYGHGISFWKAPEIVPDQGPLPGFGRSGMICGAADIAGMERRLAGLRKRTDIAGLIKPGGVGVELGVAQGSFSAALLENSALGFLYSIDMYAGDRGHDVEEYKLALRKLEPYRSRNSILRMRFDEALSLFPDDYFDFIYIDGYAHTGQEGGRTIRDWYAKAKPGAIFAGDDYSPTFPLVIEALDAFVAGHQLRLHIAEFEKSDDQYSLFPSWITVKPANHSD